VYTDAQGKLRIRCLFQRMDGEITTEGLWLTSTTPESSALDRFRVRAESLGRSGGAMSALGGAGTAILAGTNLGRYERAGMVVEYSASMDGVRQDFVVPTRPAGTGALRVELAVLGARAQGSAQGAELVLAGSGRKLAYSRLKVVDATGRELAATLHAEGEDRLVVRVDDAQAQYPVRIDPTFSDANWISMGGVAGANGIVYALAADGSGNVYAGGAFTVIGTVTANRIAKWNGSAWSALGGGASGAVYALAVSGTDLYVGGNFTTVYRSDATAVPGTGYIAKWNGSAWSALGGGAPNVVRAFAVSGTDLYVGGSFTGVYSAGTTAVTGTGYIAKWNGSAWSALGGGASGPVWALAVSGTDLYVGGDYSSVYSSGSTAVTGTRNIAKWNGSAWSALGGGTSSIVRALAVSGTDLYVGGQFGSVYSSGTTTVTGTGYIAKWNGSAWSALGSGVNNTVFALAVSGTDLYVGGQFTLAGGKVSAYLARMLVNGLIATNTLVARAPNTPLKIPISSLASDVNGNPVTLQSVGASTQGATLSFDSTYLYYLPANNDSDTVTYTVSNGSGTASGSLTISTVTDGGTIRPVSVTGGTAVLRCFGIRGISYDIQRTTSLSVPVSWSTIASALTPGTDGSFTLTDSSAPDGVAYYRLVQR
jgi:hypothetical protein